MVRGLLVCKGEKKQGKHGEIRGSVFSDGGNNEGKDPYKEKHSDKTGVVSCY